MQIYKGITFTRERKQSHLSARIKIVLVVLFIFGGISFATMFFAPEFFSSEIQSDEAVHMMEDAKKILQDQTLTMGQRVERATVLRDQADELLQTYDIVQLRHVPGSSTHTLAQLLQMADEGLELYSSMTPLLEQCAANPATNCLSYHDLQPLIHQTSDILQRYETLSLGVIPGRLQQQYSEVFVMLDEAVRWNHWFLENESNIEALFGIGEPRTYALALQNTAELRPLGGYMGSMILLHMFDGEIHRTENIDVHQFDFDAGVYIPAPDHLYHIERMAIQEANISPFTDISGAYVTDVFEQMSGTQLDGIVFLTTDILFALFDIVPELSYGGYTFTRDNVFDILQWEIEKHNISEIPQTKTPKEFFFGFIPALMTEVVACQCLDRYKTVISDVLSTQSAQVYLPYPFIEDMIPSVLTHTLPDHQEDPPLVSFSSYFNKSARFVDRTVRYGDDSIHIQLDHTYSKSKEDKIRSNIPELSKYSPKSQAYILKTLGKGDFEYLCEVYLPLDAIDIQVEGVDASDIQITPEEDFMMLRFPGVLKPGREVEIEILYGR